MVSTYKLFDGGVLVLHDPLHDVHLFLRYLLKETGIEDKEWFWYAEAQVYAEPLKWVPLLGKKLRDRCCDLPWFDIANGIGNGRQGGRKEDWYKEWTEKTGSNDVLSLVNAIETQFHETRSILEPVLGLFIAECKNQQDCVCEYYQTVLKCSGDAKKKVPYFHYLPDPTLSNGAQNDQMSHYCNYITRIRDSVKFGTTRWALIYPKRTLVVAIPLFVVEIGSPRLLATLIMILESPEGIQYSTDSLITRLLEIANSAAQLQRRGSQELSCRYHAIIDGFYGGSDSVTLLAHPAWTTPTNRQTMQLQDSQSHEGMNGFYLGKSIMDNASEGEQRKYRTGLLYARVFQRGLTPYYNENGSGQANSNNEWVGKWRGEDCDKFCVDNNGNYESFVSAIHCWLKALYCYRSDMEWQVVHVDDTSYKFNEPQVTWLMSIIKHSIKIENKNVVYNHDEEHIVDFGFPVLPGARFLIPWLAMLEHITQLEYGTDKRVEKCDVMLSKVQKYSERGDPFDLWLQRNNMRDSETPRYQYAMLLHISAKENWLGNAATGWRRRLFNPTSRKGGDTGRIQDVLACNAGPALEERGLPADRSCGLFRPLDTRGIISLDLDDWRDDEHHVLISFSW